MEEFSKHIDKKFTDQAWREMQKLLDHEMPATPASQRRAAWIFWLLLTCLGLGIGAAALWYFNQKPAPAEPAPTVPIAKAPPADAQQTTPKTSNAANSDMTTQPRTGSSNLQDKTSSPAETKNTSTTLEEAGTIAKRGEVSASPLALRSPASFPLKTQIITPASAGNESVDMPPSSINSAASSALPLQNHHPLPETTALPLTRLPLLESSPPPPPAFSMHTPSPKVARLNPPLMIFASGFANVTGGSNGLAAGILSKLDMKNKPFYLEAGLGYTYFRQPLYVVATYPDPFVQGPVTSISYDTTIAYTFKADYSQSLVASPVNEASRNYLRATYDLGLHYLTLPVTFGWKAGKRWSLHSGLSLSTLIASAPSFTRGGFLIENDRSLELLDSKSSEGSITIELEKLDLAATTGVSYHLLSGMSLSFQYQIGLLDVLPANQSGDYNRFLSLSFRYRL